MLADIKGPHLDFFGGASTVFHAALGGAKRGDGPGYPKQVGHPKSETDIKML